MSGISMWSVLVISLVMAYLVRDVVHEGHIGIYYRGSAILNGIYEPGIYFKLPIISKMVQVQVTIQTDEVRDIPCGTSGGVMISFDRIEVVNRLKKQYAWETIKNYSTHYDKTLIFDKIQYCINI
jgi:erlin